MRVLLAAAIVALVHSVVQFWAWGVASRLQLLWPWRVTSFPIFFVTPVSVSLRLFWILFIANSLIWGTVTGFLVWRWSDRKLVARDSP